MKLWNFLENSDINSNTLRQTTLQLQFKHTSTNYIFMMKLNLA